MNKKINPIDVVRFLSFTMPCVDAWTPTKINQGGCGFFAELLTKRLKEHGIPYKVWAMYFSNIDNPKQKEAEKKMNEYVNHKKEVTKIDVDHILVEVYGFFFDSSGIVNNISLAAWSKYELTDEMLHKLNYEDGDWNQVFDRNCINDIEKNLDEKFKTFPKIPELKMPGPKEVRFTDYTIKHSGMNGFLNFLMKHTA